MPQASIFQMEVGLWPVCYLLCHMLPRLNVSWAAFHATPVAVTLLPIPGTGKVSMQAGAVSACGPPTSRQLHCRRPFALCMFPANVRSLVCSESN